MMIFFTAFLAFYAFLVIFFFIKWLSIPLQAPQHDVLIEITDKYITVVIAVKNEESNIISLLNDLEIQSLPQTKFEVILVNDHSTDDTLLVVYTWALQCQINISIHSLSDTYFKKAALEVGIQKAKGEIIVCTDGDCRLGTHWLSTISSFFQTTNAKLIFGPVTFIEETKHSVVPNIFLQMQVIEFASLVGAGASCLAARFPNMCNGANIAYTKDVFQEVNGFVGNEHIQSGDDEFLMHKVYSKYPDHVHFLKSKEAIVETIPSKNLKEFYNQRKRWAGKWEHYKDSKIKLMAFFIFSVNAVHALLLILGLLFPSKYFIYAFLITMLRAIIEYAFLNSVLTFLNKKLYLVAFVLLVALYPFYVLFFALVGRVRN